MAISFIKKGADAQKEMAKAEALAEARKKGQVFRFWLKNDDEAKITFLDGDLDDDGLLKVNMFYEHQVHLNGKWTNWFVCTAENEPCPICEGGDNPSLVGAFSIIDHREYTDKKGTVHKDQVKLFVAKRETIRMLQKVATKREGLAGCTFDVSRTGEKSPSVGNVFDFVEKGKVPAILKKFKGEMPDYEKVITYMTAKELRKLGFGSTPVGAEAGLPSAKEPGEGVDYDSDL